MSRDVGPSVETRTARSERRALLVGIDEYDHLRSLSCARRDVEAVRGFLSHHEGGIPNFECEVLPATGARFDRHDFAVACDSFFDSCAGADVVFYFAGHGALEKVGGLLVASDGKKPDWGMPMCHIATLAGRSGARSVVIFLDCCHAGAFGEVELTRTALEAAFAIVPKNVTILAAATAWDVAWEDPPHGLFTSAVLQALDEKAADATTGEITALSICDAVERCMAATGQQQPVFRLNIDERRTLRRCKPIVDYAGLRQASRRLLASSDADRSGAGAKAGVRMATAILSHHGSDRALAYEVAGELGQRGVLSWMDPFEELAAPSAGALHDATARAVMVPLLSEAYVAADWCTRELRSALDAGWKADRVLPVFLGHPAELLARDSSLRDRILHEDGARGAPAGFVDRERPQAPDPAVVATTIAKATYRRVVDADWQEALVVLDQRGVGDRDAVTLPPSLASESMPALVFRPDVDARRAKKAVFGGEWRRLAERVSWGLSSAFGSPGMTRRKVRVFGHAQAGLFWLIGRHFDRTSRVDLHVYGRDGVVFTNEGQDRDAPLRGGDPRAAVHVPSTPTGRHARVAIGVGAARYASDVEGFLHRSNDAAPLYWIDPGHIADSAAATKLVGELVAAIPHLAREHGADEIALFWTSAVSVATLAAADVTSHLGPRVRFFDFDHGQRAYHELPMPAEW